MRVDTHEYTLAQHTLTRMRMHKHTTVSSAHTIPNLCKHRRKQTFDFALRAVSNDTIDEHLDP